MKLATKNTTANYETAFNDMPSIVLCTPHAGDVGKFIDLTLLAEWAPSEEPWDCECCDDDELLQTIADQARCNDKRDERDEANVLIVTLKPPSYGLCMVPTTAPLCIDCRNAAYDHGYTVTDRTVEAVPADVTCKGCDNEWF